MQSRRHKTTTRISRSNADTRANHHTKPDTRRFATIFPLKVSEAGSTGGDDTTREEQNDSDDTSRLKFVNAFEEIQPATRAASLANVDESSISSAAQQIITSYRTLHSGDGSPEHELTETGEGESPQLPEDQRSMYTLATSTDTQSTMDMMWRPKPKIHMHRVDQRALMQAQSQAIAMMQNAGLKPTNKIQCRRRGCADILSDVEALKYHLHIHNIADLATRCGDALPSIVRDLPFLVEYSASGSKTLKRNHSRSKSAHGARRKCSTIPPVPRKLSTGSLLPSLFSPREGTAEVPTVPSFTTVAKAFTPDASPKIAVSLPPRKNETPSRPSAPSRGRRKRKESVIDPLGTDYSPTIAMLLSPPPSPITNDRPVFAPRVKLPMPISPSSSRDSENQNCASIPNERVLYERLAGSRSPVRALSPTRALSPIRNGIRRILSIGSPDNFPDN